MIIKLKKGTSPIPENNKYLVLKPTVLFPTFSLAETGLVFPFTIISGQMNYEYTIPVKLSTALPVPAICNVSVDEAVLAAYNAENRTNYKLVPNYTVNDVNFTE